MKFTFRIAKPMPGTTPIEGEGATFADAIQEWHSHNLWAGVSILRPIEGGGTEQHNFAVFEGPDNEEWTSRIITRGLARKGGVKSRLPKDLQWAADKLGVSIDKLQGPWIGEQDFK